jgi:hypothetical protein
MASGNSLFTFVARDGIPTATAGAAHGILVGGSTPAEGVPVLAFDSATDEHADFINVMPRHYGGGGLTVVLQWASGVTSNAVVWDVAFRRVAENDDAWSTSHTYDYNSVTATTAGAAGREDYATITFTDGADMDSIAVGEKFCLRVRRDADNASDNMTGDALLTAIEVRET